MRRNKKVVDKYPRKGYSSDVSKTVEFTKRALKSFEKLQPGVADQILLWVGQVEEAGIHEVQRIQSFRDHPLKGKLKRSGLRSVSLSYGYRLYYRITGQGVKVVLVEDVNNHDYKEIERLFGG